MPDKFYVGYDLTGFEDNGRRYGITRVTLNVSDDTYYTSGDDTGMEIVADCPYATQAIADALLQQLKGYRYIAYNASAANLDPAAELGDGVTAQDIYSVIAQVSDDGSGYPDVSAPGEQELEDEYPTVGPTTKEYNRKLETLRKSVEDRLVDLNHAVEDVTSQITGNKGGYVVIRHDEQNRPYEILIMDEPSTDTAKNVWRWNQTGLGHSKDGYEGPFGTAITQDGQIVATYITTGVMNAALISAGVLQSRDGKTFYLDLEKGILRMDNGFKINEDGSIEATAGTFGGLQIVPGTDGTEIIGAIALTIGSMRMQANRITGLKITGENMLRDNDLMNPIQLLAAGSAGNFHALSLSDLTVNLQTGSISYSGLGGGGGDPPHTVQGYAIRGTNWRIRDTPYSDSEIIMNVSEGYAYITIGQRNLGDGFTHVTAIYPPGITGDPNSCSSPITFSTGAYISDDAVGGAVTITYR